MPSTLPKHLDFHLELANKIANATSLEVRANDTEQENEIELLQERKFKMIGELSHHITQHPSLFKYFYYLADKDILNAHGKELIAWLKNNRRNLRLMTLASNDEQQEEVVRAGDEIEGLSTVWSPFEDRAKKVSRDLDKLESQLACRGDGQSSSATVLRSGLREFRCAYEKYREETTNFQTEIAHLIRQSRLASMPLLRPIGIKETDLSVAVQEIVQEVFHPMAEIMEEDIEASTDITKNSMIQYTLEVLEHPHFVIEQELIKRVIEGLEEGEFEGDLDLDFLRFD